MPRKRSQTVVNADNDIAIAKLETRVDEIHSHLHQVNEKLDRLHTDLTKYKGMWGGLLLAAGAISVAGKFMVAWFLRPKDL